MVLTMSNMNFDEFKQEVVDRIKDFLPEKYEDTKVSLQDVMKNNDTKLSAVTITLPDSNISPTIYLNQFYEEMQNGKSMEGILSSIASVRVEHEVSQPFDVSRITDFDQVKDKIAARLIGAEMNEELLSARPHTMMDDLAVTYCVMLGEDERGSMSVPITNQLMENWNVSVEQLHGIAMENMETLTPGSFRSMNEVMMDMMMPNLINECGGDREQAEMMLEAMCPPDDGRMYVLTNEQKLNGAAIILDQKTMDQVADRVGDKFFILPSSIHELLVVPQDAGISREDLEQMVQEVNATQVEPQERLSDHVYIYDAKEHELFRADHEQEHMQAKEAAKEAMETDKTAANKEVKTPDRSLDKEPAKKRTSVKEKLATKKKEVEARDEKAPAKAPTKKKETCI